MSEECEADILYSTLEEDIAYIRSVEMEFTARVDDMLKMFNLYHLRVKRGEELLEG